MNPLQTDLFSASAKRGIFWCDIETTGLNIYQHGICQIAWIVDIDGDVYKEGSSYVRPYRTDRISRKALEVNGIPKEHLETFPSPMQVKAKIYGSIPHHYETSDMQKRLYFGGYNAASFDLPRFRRFMARDDRSLFFQSCRHYVIDPLPLLTVLQYRNNISLPNLKLETVCKHFGIPIQAHDALSDIRATRTLYYTLQGAFLR